MAIIVSSTFTLDAHTQADGSSYVREVHTWDDGFAPTVIDYGPVPAGFPYQATANARAVAIQASFAETEFEDLIGGA